MASDSPTLRRVARHLALAQLGAEGQTRISESSVLLIGVGGIGCAAAQYLVAAGIGRLVLVDFDRVDASNLGRQVLFGDADDGREKVSVAFERLRAQNPDCRIDTVAGRLAGDALRDAVVAADVVLDGSDNFATRFAVNEACVAMSRPLVSGAAIRFEGQLAVFGPDFAASPCYRCLYSEADESLDSCAGNGVLGPVPGVIGTLMAAETLKLAAGLDVERGRLTLYDALASEFRRLRIDKRSDCEVCG